MKGVSLPFRATTNDFTKWLGAINERTTVDDWGIGHEHAADGSHFEQLIHPLGNVQSPEKIADYPFPLPASAERCCRMQRDNRADQTGRMGDNHGRGAGGWNCLLAGL